MPLKPFRKFTLPALALAFAQLARAADSPVPSDPSRPLLDAAVDIISDLQQKKTFFQDHRAESLLAQAAADQFLTKPLNALEIARTLKEPFYASLALGACAAQSIASDPEAAQQLLLGAQERALSIHGYMDSDATSLQYLFQLHAAFSPADGKKLLAASRRNLAAWLAGGMEKSKPMLELARQAIAFDPDSVEPLLADATADPWKSPHFYESVQQLATHLAHANKQWAADQVETFYTSGKSMPGTHEILFALLIDDALRDPPGALQKINAMPAEDQDQLRFYIAINLRDVGRRKEADAIVEALQARIAAKAPGIQWIAGALPKTLERWAVDDQRAAQPARGAITADQIDALLVGLTADDLRIHIAGRPLQFRNSKQAAAFLAVAVPAAKKIADFGGYPRHGSPQSVALGTLAQLAAQLNDPAQAKSIADDITIPELRAFYLLNAYEALHSLPVVVHEWPIYFYQRVELKIDAI